jgi:hypothetical protein
MCYGEHCKVCVSNDSNGAGGGQRGVGVSESLGVYETKRLKDGKIEAAHI